VTINRGNYWKFVLLFEKLLSLSFTRSISKIKTKILKHEAVILHNMKGLLALSQAEFVENNNI
jgi:hypothetical protein